MPDSRLNEDVAGRLEGLQSLPGVGESIARAIRDVLAHGRLAILERLRGESDPIALLASVPGIGRTLADRLHHELGIDTLEDLEAAATATTRGENGSAP